jgi:hypothetical protein
MVTARKSGHSWMVQILICLLATTTFAQPVPLLNLDEDPILLATLRYLDQGLRSADPVRMSELLGYVAGATDHSQQQVRAHLIDRLQAMADLRQQGGDDWERLVDLGGELSRRQLSRFIDHLGRHGREILHSSDDYLLDTTLRWAAREARIPPQEALHFVNRIVAAQLVNDPLAPAAEPVGVVVNGWTEKYEFRLEPLLIYLESEDEAAAREAVRDIQRFIVPAVVRGLPSASGVAWAFRQRDLTALVDPTYDVRLRVRTLRFSGLSTNLQPCIDIGIQIIDTQSQTLASEFDVAHCGVASVSPRRLSLFFDEVANVVVDTLVPFFDSRR